VKITVEEVEHVARLARLALDKDAIDTITGQMGSILDYVEKLNQLDTEGIEPTAHVVSVENAFRDDVVTASLETETVLANAPDTAPGYFRVPKIIE